MEWEGGGIGMKGVGGGGGRGGASQWLNVKTKISKVIKPW